MRSLTVDELIEALQAFRDEHRGGGQFEVTTPGYDIIGSVVFEETDKPLLPYCKLENADGKSTYPVP